MSRSGPFSCYHLLHGAHPARRPWLGSLSREIQGKERGGTERGHTAGSGVREGEGGVEGEESLLRSTFHTLRNPDRFMSVWWVRWRDLSVL